KGGQPVKKLVFAGGVVREALVFALRGSSISESLEIDDELWGIKADEGQLSQVLHNLVINAQQAMPEGGSISVKCANIVLDEASLLNLRFGSYIRITVKDTGVGISGETIEKVFDPYFTTKEDGSGLGLATSYAIIEKHGGLITVESALGEGTSFSIYLPAIFGDTVMSKTTEVVRRQGHGRVLVMDDELLIGEVVCTMLEKCGYETEFVIRGEQAIEAYEKAMGSDNPFKVVILDLTIKGGMGGRKTIERLKELDPSVKAIVSSGYSNDPVMSSYREYGFEGIVEKPCTV
ncbi:MAG: response regulator, partial [Deltaproteobacteria bacterium]|nr:response regulator [Deltaproteobacteria bacterium]